MVLFVCLLLNVSWDVALFTYFLLRDKLVQYHPQWNLDDTEIMKCIEPVP